MQSILFPNRTRNILAVAISLLALLAVASYLGGRTNAVTVKLLASYTRAADTLVEGVVKAPNGRPDLRGEVVLLFRNGHGGALERKTVHVNRHGRFHVVAPYAARSVLLTAYLHPGRNAPHGSRSLPLLRDKALVVTVVFYRTAGGILPAIFPY